MKFLVAFLALCGSAALAAPTVDEKVLTDLASAGVSTVILHFKAEHQQVLNNYINEYKPHERSVDTAVLDNILRNHANEQQASTLSLLNARKAAKASGSIFSQLWAVNLLVVNDVDAELLELLKSNEEISHIEADREHQLIDFGTIRIEESAEVNVEGAWGVPMVKAPEAWAAGYEGEGVVVGVIDTGIRYTHDILKANFREDFNFKDNVNGRTDAYDDQGHGTHCAGSIAGTGEYGVAPKAQLIACKALSNTGSGSTTGLLGCGQWMYCPTDAAGKEDCTKRPDVVSNSWGTTVSNTFYNNIIDTWRAAGMVGVFANGNSGPGCKTTGSPADYAKALSVGATDSTDKLAYFSSRGPSTVLGTRKPDVSAPGAAIKSAGITNDQSYATMSGTSMATPHVAGVVALLKGQNKSLDQDAILRLLEQGADKTGSVEETCVMADTEYPNNHVGHGRVNAARSLKI